MIFLGAALVFSQSAPLPSFEAASIKPNNSGAAGTDFDSDTGRISMKNATVRRWIQNAYGVPEAQVLGGPKWVDNSRYDIEAKSAGPAGAAQLNLMLQNLLMDRCQLSLHRETRQLSGYALTVAKGGIKAKPSAPGAGSSTQGGRGRIEAAGCSMAKLAVRLSAVMKVPVTDLTGTTGGYDFRLDWTPEELLAVPQTDVPTGPSIFTALQEQLGLKLESRKVPTEVLVIDRVELPSEN
jgi:uncharacterized protein (TIGR03435 family)